MILYTLYENSYIDIKHKKSLKGVKVYVNMTNRCPCACTFCLRQTKEMMKGNSLWLEKEPTVQEVIDEFKQYHLSDFAEVIFCGFGEPLERIMDIIDVIDYLKQERSDLPVRMNTNGLANMIHQKDITPLLKNRVDTISISLNAPEEKEYLELTRSKFGIESFQAMLQFATLCKPYVPNVVLTVVDIIGEEKIKACQKICNDLDVTLRVRPFEE